MRSLAPKHPRLLKGMFRRPHLRGVRKASPMAHPLVRGGVLALAAMFSQPVLAACGDGVVDSGETCDDYNSSDGDGCSSACAEESGWDCSTTAVAVGSSDVLDDSSGYSSPSWTASPPPRPSTATPLCTRPTSTRPTAPWS